MRESSSPNPTAPAVSGPGTAVHLFHHSLTRGGGMERYAQTLARSLLDLGCAVTIYPRRVDDSVARDSMLQVKLAPVRRFPRALQDFRYFRQIEQVRPQATGLQIALSRVRAGHLAVCGGTHRGYLRRARKRAGPLDLLQIWMETECYRAARRVVSHSKLCQEELLRWYRLPPEKVVTLYPPLDAEFCPARNGEEVQRARQRFGLPDHKVVFLFPSTGHRRKGLYAICQALRGLPAEAFVLAVAGKAPRQTRDGFLRPLGYVDDMAAAYRAADFTILGSFYEPFGLVGPESVLCGTRLVFEENIGCLEVVQPECVIRFSVWNPDSIRRAVTDAIALARQGKPLIAEPASALTYDPSPLAHARALLTVARG
jgi:glycosyltransferase involved in cell wall biosynthesis